MTKPPASAINAVENYLVEQIRSRAIRPGQPLPSRQELADRFGIALSSVGVAVKRLGEKHPLRFVPGHGVFLDDPERRPRVRTIAMIGPYATHHFEHPGQPASVHGYWGPIHAGILAACGKANCALTYVPNVVRAPVDWDYIESFRADCVVSFGLPITPGMVMEAKRRGVRLVLGNRPDDDVLRLGVSYADFDNAGSFRSAVREFARRGHRRIGCVYGETSQPYTRAAWAEAFMLEAAAQGLAFPARDYIRVHPPGVEDYPAHFARLVGELLDTPLPPTAIYCHNSAHMFERLGRELVLRQKRVARDVSLLAIDTSGLAGDLPMSAMIASPAELGRGIVETAVAVMDDPQAVVHRTVPFEFHDFGSIGPGLTDRDWVI